MTIIISPYILLLLEIDFSKVGVLGAKAFIFGSLIYIITLGISIFLTYKLGYGFYLAIILSSSAGGLILPTLRELGLLKSDFGQTILITVFVAISEVADVEAILGAFLAGVIFSILFRGGTVLEQKLFGIGYGFLIPIFFISVGMQFDLGALAGGGIYLVPMLLLIAFVVKIVPSLLFIVRYSVKDSISAGVLLTSRLSLIIAMAAVGLELGLIDATMESAIILLAIITCICCPTIFRKMQGGLKQAES